MSARMQDAWRPPLVAVIAVLIAAALVTFGAHARAEAACERLQIEGCIKKVKGDV